MFDVLRFWFERGVDGFRIDVLWHIFKDAHFRDNPPNPDYQPGRGEMHRVLQLRSTDQPEVHAVVAEMRRIADGFGARVLIGEVCLPLEKLMRYYGRDGDELHLAFNFQLVDALPGEWNAPHLAAMIAAYEAALPAGGWPNWVLGNHDSPRIAARRGDAQARVAAMLLLTLRGTPTLYAGDELGIGQVDIPPDRVRDPRELREPGLGLGRDPARTPMPWDETENAGFTSGVPWLPLNPDWHTRNAARLAQEPDSLLALHRRLLALRRVHTALSLGSVSLLQPRDSVLAYERAFAADRLLVCLNLGPSPRAFPLPSWAHGARVLLSTVDTAPHGVTDRVSLRSDEGVILAPPAP
jgi:glycosidase